MENEKIIDKIQKLLRLATSSNEYEAANAAARAAELMHEYQISEAVLSVKSGNAPIREGIVEQTIDGKGRHNKENWKAVIVYGIGKATGVYAYTHKGEIRLFGRISQVQTAKYMFDYLVNTVNRLADTSYSSWYGHAKKWKNNFRRGCAFTIQKRLLEIAAKNARPVCEERALAIIIVDKKQVEDAWNRRTEFMHLKKANPVSLSDMNAFNLGKEAGNEIDLENNKTALPGRKKELI